MKQIFLALAVMLCAVSFCPAVNAQDAFDGFLAVGPLSTECQCADQGYCICKNCTCENCKCQNCSGKLKAVVAVAEETKIVLVTAEEWCQPCRIFRPIWDKVVAETKDMKFEVVDVSEWSGSFATHPVLGPWGVEKVPTVLEVKGDKAVVRYRPGGMTDGQLRGAVRDARQ